MKKPQVREARAQYKAAPKSVAAAIDEAEVVADFLPPPEALVPVRLNPHPTRPRGSPEPSDPR